MPVRIKDICIRLSSGNSIQASQIKENGIYPVYGGNGLRGYTDDFNFNGECVLIGRQGEQCGNIHYLKGKAYITEHAIVLCVKKDINARYIACLLSLIDLRRFSSQSAQPGISVETLGNIEINILDYESQDKIGKLIDIIEEQIKYNNLMVNKLQVLSQIIFNKWFVQFDYPGADGKLYFNSDLKKEIPIKWTTCKLTECIKWESASQPPKSEFIYEQKAGYIRFIQNRDYDSASHITYIPHKNSTKTCTKWDIMMDKYGDAGKIRCGLEGAYNVALAKITPIIRSSQEYIRQFLLLDSNYQYLHNACMASTRASLNENTLNGIIIAIPENEILEKYELIMKNILKCRFSIIDSTTKLQYLKEKLLPLLINGQLY